jgi:hypothetical protein
MDMIAALFRDTKSFLLGFNKADLKILLKAALVALLCVLLYQCKLFNEHAKETYDCKYVSQIGDWVCIDKKNPLNQAVRVL